ncbi:hypothetical protein AQUCO_07600064v1 [Aquilegia coerulea]|uniref:Uncharacterized protein n=1 Tax=Aquilegia coerulea TaxID=218851 RepID=A0A2G5C8N3_AQUCA|nr:hypothetical protein AQUCO_07600064v1 [Aquilegia coerulea]
MKKTKGVFALSDFKLIGSRADVLKWECLASLRQTFASGRCGGAEDAAYAHMFRLHLLLLLVVWWWWW